MNQRIYVKKFKFLGRGFKTRSWAVVVNKRGQLVVTVWREYCQDFIQSYR